MKEEAIGLAYAAYGRAMEAAQALEVVVVQALVLNGLLSRTIEPYKQAEVLENLSKETLGKLLGLLKQVGAVEPSLDNELGKALKLRNYLAHHYFRAQGDRGRRSSHPSWLEDAEVHIRGAASMLAEALAGQRKRLAGRGQLKDAVRGSRKRLLWSKTHERRAPRLEEDAPSIEEWTERCECCDQSFEVWIGYSSTRADSVREPQYREEWLQCPWCADAVLVWIEDRDEVQVELQPLFEQDGDSGYRDD